MNYFLDKQKIKKFITVILMNENIHALQEMLKGVF